MHRFKQIATTCTLASGLTYLSLLVPGSVVAVCGDLGAPIYCTLLAYGFPLPFLADGRVTSPIGSVARDPLSLLLGLDEVLWGPLGLSVLFWLLTVIALQFAWRRLKRHKSVTPPGW